MCHLVLNWRCHLQHPFSLQLQQHTLQQFLNSIVETHYGNIALAEGFPSHSARSKMGQHNETHSIALLHLLTSAAHTQNQI